MYFTAVSHVHGKKVFKVDYCMIMLDGGHWRHLVELVRDDDRLAWTAEPLHMWYALLIVEKLMNSAQEIKPRKIANISTATVRWESSFPETIESVLNYARAFEEDYAMSFVDDMMSSNFFVANAMATYARYICVASTIIKTDRVFLLPVSLAMDALVVKTLCITHLADPGLYISTKEDILLMIQAAGALVKINHNPAPFPACLSCRHARSLLDEIHVFNMKQAVEKFPTFTLFPNKDPADEKRHPSNYVPIYYHDASFRFWRKGNVEELEGEGRDATEAAAFKSGPPFQPR